MHAQMFYVQVMPGKRNSTAYVHSKADVEVADIPAVDIIRFRPHP